MWAGGGFSQASWEKRKIDFAKEEGEFHTSGRKLYSLGTKKEPLRKKTSATRFCRKESTRKMGREVFFSGQSWRPFKLKKNRKNAPKGSEARKGGGGSPVKGGEEKERDDFR